MEATWNIDTPWFDIAFLTFFFMLGHIFFAPFTERESKLRKVLKYVLTLVVLLVVIQTIGRIYAWGLLGLSLIPLIYVHGILLPRKGINGWTGEPKGKYYELRGWSKDIF